jgi:hypothetical protein
MDTQTQTETRCDHALSRLPTSPARSTPRTAGRGFSSSANGCWRRPPRRGLAPEADTRSVLKCRLLSQKRLRLVLFTLDNSNRRPFCTRLVDILCISLDCGLICRPLPCVIGVGRRTDEVRSAGRIAEPNRLGNFCDREAS